MRGTAGPQHNAPAIKLITDRMREFNQKQPVGTADLDLQHALHRELEELVVAALSRAPEIELFYIRSPATLSNVWLAMVRAFTRAEHTRYSLIQAQLTVLTDMFEENTMETPYDHTHITWRTRNTDGSVSNLVNIIHDRGRAADEVKELILNPAVFAVRAIDYPAGDDPAEMEGTTFHTRIGPPVSH